VTDLPSEERPPAARGENETTGVNWRLDFSEDSRRATVTILSFKPLTILQIGQAITAALKQLVQATQIALDYAEMNERRGGPRRIPGKPKPPPSDAH
jgi:hypothetical protein